MPDFWNKDNFKSFVKILIYLSVALIIFIPFILKDEYEFGKLLGNLAAFTFILAGTPGVLRRFKASGILNKVQSLLMYSRAQLGILMFLLAVGHYLLVFILPILALGTLPTTLRLFELLGVASLYLSFPLFLTSNTWAKRKLKKWWGRLHMLVYIIIWTIFLHVALREISLTAVLLLIFGALQISSLAYAKFNK